MRVSVMLHLPALASTKQIDKVFNAVSKMNLAVRGFYGEGTKALSDFYQISNQVTLGKAPDALLDDGQVFRRGRGADGDRDISSGFDRAADCSAGRTEEVCAGSDPPDPRHVPGESVPALPLVARALLPQAFVGLAAKRQKFAGRRSGAGF